MLGCSIFLGKTFTENEKAYLIRMKELGAKTLFTSIHIPEEDPDEAIMRLKILGEFASTNQLDLIVDTTKSFLEKNKYGLSQITEFKKWGITGIRLDDGFSPQEIVDYSQLIRVGLNASTLTELEIQHLLELGVNRERLEAWHNYYPRPETGLSSSWFAKKNQLFQNAGIRVVAFISGDAEKRGPLRKGLPTLEEQRDLHPIAAYLTLTNTYGVDEVCVGDPALSNSTLKQFETLFLKQQILLHVTLLDEFARNYVLRDHCQRPDVACDVVRANGSRSYATQEILPLNCDARPLGSITIDNHLYGRYAGELQITKRNLPADEKVNVVAKIVPRDHVLLHWIDGDQAFTCVLENEGEKR